MPILTPETRAHRRDLAELSRRAESDLRVLFREFNTADAARDGLRDVLPGLTLIYGEAAVALAADWYDDLRDAAGARGRFSPVLADLPDRGRTDALAGWGVSPLYAAEPDFDTALLKVAGGLQRIIVNADRQTVMASSVEDRAARGWERVGAGECEFCQKLIGRGAVYTEATADFESHDHCGCIAVPAF
jgi:hypothetical protein